MNSITILPALRALMAQDQRLPRLERISTTTQVVITLPDPCTDVVATVKAALPPGATEVTLTGIGSFRAIFDAPAGRASGKIAVVTGGAQGFGFEIATDLAKQGATVVLADINAEGVKTASEKINAGSGRTAAFGVTMNVADVDSIKAGLEQVVSTFGGVDLFVANAGVLRAGSVKDLTVKDLDFVTNVNYKGYFLCVQAVAPIFALQHQALPDIWFDIIQINSKSGLVGSNKNGAYAGSKFGGIGLTQSFAMELVEDGVKVNSICPGNFYDGPLWADPEKGLFRQYLDSGKVPGAKTFEDVKRFYEAKVPMRRGCTTPDVMKAIYYLMEQTYETGQAIPVTGGQVMLA